MEKSNNSLPKPYKRLGTWLILELMEDFPPFADSFSANQKKKELKSIMQVRIRIMQHNGRYFLYKVITNNPAKNERKNY